MLADRKERLRGRGRFRCFFCDTGELVGFTKNVIDPTKLYQRLGNATRVIKMIFHCKFSYLLDTAIYIRMIQEAKYDFWFRL